MGFFKQQENLDLGQISIENIFINDFMPSANGTYVKVYLLGYKYANDSVDISNKLIAKHLNISIDDVINAWKFWENKNVVNIHAKDNDDKYDFDVEFLSLRQLYIENNFSQVKEEAKNFDSEIDQKLRIMNDNSFKKMFKKIGYIMSRQLSPNEKMKILDWIENYNVDLKVVIKAFNKAVNDNNVRNLNYVQSIVRNWSDDGIVSIGDLNEYLSKNTDRYKTYRKIYKILGYNMDAIAEAHENLFDKWLDKYQFDKEFLYDLLREISKKTNHINMNYVESIIDSTYNDQIETIEEFKNKKVKRTKKRSSKKNKFHNYTHRGNNYTEEELEKILGIKE